MSHVKKCKDECQSRYDSFRKDLAVSLKNITISQEKLETIKTMFKEGQYNKIQGFLSRLQQLLDSTSKRCHTLGEQFEKRVSCCVVENSDESPRYLAYLRVFGIAASIMAQFYDKKNKKDFYILCVILAFIMIVFFLYFNNDKDLSSDYKAISTLLSTIQEIQDASDSINENIKYLNIFLQNGNLFKDDDQQFTQLLTDLQTKTKAFTSSLSN